MIQNQSVLFRLSYRQVLRNHTPEYRMILNQSVLFRLSYRQVLRNHTPEYKKILNESPLLQSAGTEKPHTWIQNDSEPIGTVSFNLQVLQSLTPEYTIILNESLLLQPAGTENPHIWVQNDSERIATASFNLQLLRNHTPGDIMILNKSPLLQPTGTENPPTWVQNDSQRIASTSTFMYWKTTHLCTERFSINRHCFNLQVLKTHTSEYRMIVNEIATASFNLQVLKKHKPEYRMIVNESPRFNLQVLRNHTTRTRVQNDSQRSVQLCFSVTASEGDLRPFPLVQVNEKVVIIRSSAHSTIRSSYVSDRRLSLIIIPGSCEKKY